MKKNKILTVKWLIVFREIFLDIFRSKRNIIFIVVFLIGTAFFAYGLQNFKDAYRISALLLTYPISFVIAGTLRLVLLVHVPAKSMILVHSHPTHVFEKSSWLWKRQFKEYMVGDECELVSYGREAHKVWIEVQTDPPLGCIFGITRTSGKNSFLGMRKFMDSYSSELGFYLRSYGKFIEFLAYEFAKEKRTELGRLDNPADQTQQKRYIELISEFLESRLGAERMLHPNLCSEFELLTKSDSSIRKRMNW